MKKPFIKSMLSGANGNWSSKRIVGCICILFAFYLILFLEITKGQIMPEEAEIIEHIMYVGAALLGMGVFEKKHPDNPGREYDIPKR